ncbi:MAG: VOC family protein [Bacteroidota bacterium]
MGAKMGSGTNALNWFEIPVKDMDRAVKFYQTIFEISMERMEIGGMTMAMFPTDFTTGVVGGGLVKSEMHIPSETGSVIYLNANPDLDLVLNRIGSAGGSVVMPKTLIDEQTGYMAFFNDTEGNRVALHSNA